MLLKEKKISEDMVKEIVEKTRKGEIGGPLSLEVCWKHSQAQVEITLS